MKLRLVAIFVALGGVSPAASARASAQPPELTDQHGVADGLGAHRGRVVVALVADLRALRRVQPWEVDLRERLGDVAGEIRFLRVADVPPGRGITRERVLERLGGRIPEEVSILLDLEGAWRREYDLETHRPNVLLFDREGRLVYTIRGLSEPEVVGRVAAWIEELRVERRAR